MGDFQKKPPPKHGGPEKKSGGGFWSFLGDLINNVSVGGPGRSDSTSRNPTDPRERMEPVHAERKEAYEETIYRKTDGAEGTAPAVRVDRDRKAIARSLDTRRGTQAETRVPQSGGASLSRDLRAKMEPRLGSDLSNVRVHTDGESATAAEGFSAKAFTVGNDVHFGSGQYQPGTKEGDKLLAHELTHVVQGQRSGIQRKAETPGDGGHEDEAAHDGGHADAPHGAEVSHPDEPAEKEADAIAEHVSGQLEAEGAQGGGEQGGHAGEGGHALGGAGGEKVADAHDGGKPAGTDKGKAGGKGSKAGGSAKTGSADGAPKGQHGAEKSGTEKLRTAGAPRKMQAAPQPAEARKRAAKGNHKQPVTRGLGARRPHPAERAMRAVVEVSRPQRQPRRRQRLQSPPNVIRTRSISVRITTHRRLQEADARFFAPSRRRHHHQRPPAPQREQALARQRPRQPIRSSSFARRCRAACRELPRH